MDKAFSELNEKLRHPSDVDSRLDSILARYREQEIKELEKVHFMTNTQTDGIKRILGTLKNSKYAMEQLATEKKECAVLLRSNRHSLNEYRTIEEIARAHESFTKTLRFVQSLEDTEVKITEDDLLVHAGIIFDKEEFMCEVKLYNYDLTHEESRIVQHKLNSLKKASLEFTSVFLQTLNDYVENIGLFKKIDTMIAREEKRDEIIRYVKLGEESKDPVAKQYYLCYTKYVHIETKNLKERSINVIKSGIHSKFEKIKTEEDSVNKLEFIFEDLGKLQERSLQIFTFDDFCQEYHRELKRFFTEKLSVTEPENILGIVEFKSRYYNVMKEFGKSPEFLGSKLIEDEANLLQKYSEIASSRLKEWIDNIAAIEIERFVTRDPEINNDEQGKLVSSGFINLLQIIKAQLEPITFNKRIFLFLTNTIKERCNFFHEKIRHALKSELKEVLEGQKLRGFEDYCVMFGNSGLRLTQYISSLPFFQSDEVRDLQQIFLGILKSSNDTLCKYVINTCNPAFSKAFTDEWASSQQRKIFLITLEDFLQDYRRSMSEYVFGTFVCELCTKIYVAYKQLLVSSKTCLDVRLSESIKTDVKEITKYLSKFTGENTFAEFLAPIQRLCPLLDILSGELFIVELKSLVLADSEITEEFVRNLISRKKDMEKTERDFVLSKLPEVFSREQPRRKTLISKILSKR